MTAAEVLAARVEEIRVQGRAARRLAARLDGPGMPARLAERAADAATILERLAAELAAHLELGRTVSR